jgi:hypothetical protein
MFRRTILAQVPKRSKRAQAKPSDNTSAYDKGAVEWLPRPVRLTHTTIEGMQQLMMRQQLDAHYEEINKIRDLHRQWSQHPTRPVLGDVEPKFPRGVYKDAHQAKRRFVTRWHRANAPNNWLWMPRATHAPEHRATSSDYPEQWKAMRDAAALARAGRPTSNVAANPSK